MRRKYSDYYFDAFHRLLSIKIKTIITIKTTTIIINIVSTLGEKAHYAQCVYLSLDIHNQR